jgi:hypothetical protein
MPGGSAGSEKSTVAGSRPINITRFIASSAKLELQPAPSPAKRLVGLGIRPEHVRTPAAP